MKELMSLKELNISQINQKCMICHYWYFKGIGYKYQPHVCNGCDDLSVVRKSLSWKEVDEMKNIDQKYYCSNYYDASLTKCGAKCETS